MVELKEAARSVLIEIGRRTAKQGPFGVDADVIGAATGLPPRDVNDAVDQLTARGLAKSVTGVGTRDGYEFLHVKLTADGLAAYEESQRPPAPQNPPDRSAADAGRTEMDEQARQAIESAGWEVWESVTEKKTGGGQCFFCCRTSAAESLAGALAAARASHSAPGVQHYRPELMKWFRAMWKDGTRLDDLVAVVKVAHAPDARFDREVRVLKKLQHPNLVRVYAHDEASPPKWFVMELHRGGDLERKRDEYHGGQQPRLGGPATFRGSISEVLRRLRGVAEAVAVLHRGDGEQRIIHRDIKPGNVLVAVDGRWILTDLGIALDTEGERLTGSELLLSRDWRPDWVVGTDDYTERMDIQMVANLAYYLVAGRKPPPFSQFGRPDYDLRRLQLGIPGVDELHNFVTDHIAGTEAGVKSRTAVELVSAIDAVLARLSPHREPRLLYSFTSARSDGDALGETIGSSLGALPVQIPRHSCRVTAYARVVGRSPKLWFTLERVGEKAVTLKSSERYAGSHAGSSDPRGGWNGDPMELELQSPFDPGEYLLTLHSQVPGGFSVSAFIVHAD